MEQEIISIQNTGFLTVHELASYLRISEAKVYRLANAGNLPAIRFGKSWRFRKDLVEEWIRKKVESSILPSR